MKTLSHSTALKVAAAISPPIGAASAIGALPIVTEGAATVDQSGNQPPFAIVVRLRRDRKPALA